MTKRFIFIALCSIVFNLLAQAQNPVGVRTFTKSFNAAGKSTLVLELPGSIDLKIWDNPNVKIEISASLANGNAAMLNELANVGRYNLVASSEGDALNIKVPNLQKQVKVKGEVLKENMTYVVFAPKNVKVDMRTAAPAAPVLAERK